MGNSFRAVWTKIQITSAIVTSGLSRSSGTHIPSTADEKCISDVDTIIGRPNTPHGTFHCVRVELALRTCGPDL